MFYEATLAALALVSVVALAYALVHDANTRRRAAGQQYPSVQQRPIRPALSADSRLPADGITLED